MINKIASIVGARPQFIKLAPLSRELRNHFSEIVIHTGQHYDYEMSQLFFDEMQIPPPDYHLDIGSGTHAYQVGEMLTGIERILLEEKPDLVIVYGDTNSTIAGALTACKMHIRVAHVEAGLRSFDRTMPEEINRILTDRCSDLLFCPTQTAVSNLKTEGISEGVFLTGDVMVDALSFNKDIAEKSDILEKLGIKSGEYLVATVHRQSNTDNRKNLESIAAALSEIDDTVVFPLHPRTEKMLKEFGLYEDLEKNVMITRPLGYLDFLKLENHARIILTDSGGVQKEACILGVPCVTLRENTEWVETVEEGWNVLVGTDKEKIVEKASGFQPARQRTDIYGTNVSAKISDIISRQ